MSNKIRGNRVDKARELREFSKDREFREFKKLREFREALPVFNRKAQPLPKFTILTNFPIFPIFPIITRIPPQLAR